MNIEFAKIKEHIDSFNYEIDDFERIQLLPEIIDRLIYIKTCMQSFQNICNDEHTALLIDESVRKVVKPEVIKLSAPEPGVGKSYLELTHKMIQESFIDPIDKLTQNEKKEKALESISQLVLYFNEVNHVFRSICDCENKLFKYSFKNFVNIKNTKTGIVLVSPPEHLEVILVPFETGLKELVSVASTSLRSIEMWGEQVRDRKEKFISLSVNISQVQVAEEQAKAAIEQANASKGQAIAAKYALAFQIAVIFFTLILLGGSYKLNLYLDKLELEKIIERNTKEIKTANMSIQSLKQNIISLNNELESVQKELGKFKKIKVTK